MAYVVVAVLVLVSGAPVSAQQPGADQQGRPSPQMMQMCRQMMAMRGEMMKAMGDIMVKYAERMRPAK
jgi:hypothetical protein